MLTKEMQRNVETLHKKRDFRRLNELFRTMPAVDVAEFIRPWPLQDRIQVLEELPVAESAKIFSGGHLMASTSWPGTWDTKTLPVS